uniref:Uncharacterized protein n=1 Tax=Arundo donax TaxID=35708 RepID=A0A0A9CDM7_ARUDO
MERFRRAVTACSWVFRSFDDRSFTRAGIALDSARSIRLSVLFLAKDLISATADFRSSRELLERLRTNASIANLSPPTSREEPSLLDLLGGSIPFSSHHCIIKLLST